MSTTGLLHRILLLAACIASWTVVAGVRPGLAQTIVVMVNGDPITEYDIEQRSKLTFLTTRKTATRQEVLNELIDERIKLKEGKKYGVDPTSADIEQSFASMGSRMRLTPEQLTKSLESQGVRAETLKARMKAEMVWTSLVRGRFKERLQVGEKDIEEALRAEGGSAQQLDAFEYKLQPIVLIVPRGSAPATIELRKKEAETLRGRIQSCEEANGLLKAMPNAAIREQVTKTSADIPQVLRKLLDETPVGRLTPPEITKQGVEMVALCARKPTTVDSPKRREIREKMFAKKYEATSKAYLDEIRKAAMIERR